MTEYYTLVDDLFYVILGNGGVLDTNPFFEVALTVESGGLRVLFGETDRNYVRGCFVVVLKRFEFVNVCDFVLQALEDWDYLGLQPFPVAFSYKQTALQPIDLIRIVFILILRSVLIKAFLINYQGLIIIIIQLKLFYYIFLRLARNYLDIKILIQKSYKI